ncbi:MAG: hypothetical protein EP343_10535 [Deltaproteobacteria bacterium]|nr:MAG: hypothetical protein EP343_10535 [Deltaproteobacteria bacterium]
MKHTQASWIANEADLRRCIAKPFKKVLQKIQNHIDEGTASWITKSRLAGIATLQPDSTLYVSLCAHATDLITVEQGLIRLRSQALDQNHAEVANHQPRPAGMLVMLPGLDSTIRINGTLERAPEGESLYLNVEESYYHCPKAFLRSGLWRERPDVPTFSPGQQEGLGAQSRTFLEQSPFALLATCSEEGQVDLSPRGDPPGFVRIVGENTLLVPERTGNRIVDSLRNILSCRHVSLMMLLPGSSWTLQIQGEARITNESSLLEASSIKGKVPKVGVVVEVTQTLLQRCSALDDSQIWNPDAYVDPDSLLSPGELIVRQAQPKGRLLNLKGKVVDWVLNQDAKRNLY